MLLLVRLRIHKVKHNRRFTFIDGVSRVPVATLLVAARWIGEHVIAFAFGLAVIVITVLALRRGVDPASVLKLLKTYGYVAGFLCISLYRLIRTFIKSKKVS